MDENRLVIRKNPQLPLAEDYDTLRQWGLQHIEELGSANWTDYNAHDPGITILEALCFALSEVGYRSGFDIADILTEEKGFIGLKQALFTARRILSNSPLTVNDFRKVLVDIPNIRNGWLVCKQCACEVMLYAECKESALFFAPLWRLKPPLPRKLGGTPHEHPVFPRGLYDVLVELEEDPELGDLNDRKITHIVNYELPEEGRIVPLTIEVRFPEWEPDQPELFALFTQQGTVIDRVQLDRFSRDRVLNEPVDSASFVQGWRNPFFADYKITFNSDKTLLLKAAIIRLFSPKESLKRAIDIGQLQAQVLSAIDSGSIIGKYQRKLQTIRQATQEASFALHQYRNLGEDFCRIECVHTEDIGVCMDVEVGAEADIEWVLANIYNEIELWFNPLIQFYTLNELEIKKDATVEENTNRLTTDAIFEGPALANGFIKTEEIEASQLRSVFHVSDLLNRLMDIDSIHAVKDLQLARYDRNGYPISPPERWSLTVSPDSIPRLYIEVSRILFYKNGLPFMPRLDEVRAILVQLRGGRERPKIPEAEKDYPVPTGKRYELAEYTPIQHTLPRTYGIGPEGLSDTASAERKGQAKQLKGYMMVYEQLTANLLEQLAHTNQLFSTDEGLKNTYFTHVFGAIEPLNSQATEQNLTALIEPDEVFYDRRNRFLDHMLARFGEQFRDYALALYSNTDRVALAPDKLIRDKSQFLCDYPRISTNRARAFNYRDAKRLNDPRNRVGLAERISRLLGIETFRRYFNVTVEVTQQQFSAHFELREKDSDQILLKNYAPIEEATEDKAWELIGDVIANSIELTRYSIDASGASVLTNEQGEPIARLEPTISSDQVRDFATKILEKERLYIVENLLLRPKFPGDAVMPVCLEADCSFCGEEDPYSFLITYVIQGDLAPFSLDIDLRRFADTTIRKETPAHLLPKICWVSDAKCREEYTPAELTELESACICLPDDAHCRQFSRFEKAWVDWLTANAPFDWQKETRLLHKRVESLVLKYETRRPKENRLAMTCHCSDLLIGYFGNRFRNWIDDLVSKGTDPSDETVTSQLEAIWTVFMNDITLIYRYDLAFCLPGLQHAKTFWAQLKALLLSQYGKWMLVSYRLNALIRLYSDLSSIYPTATLHDCDDGSDDNPVRLNTTILGSL